MLKKNISSTQMMPHRKNRNKGDLKCYQLLEPEMCVASGLFVFLCEPMVLSIHASLWCLSPLFPATILPGHLLL